ncbi:MAG: hypothetical protein C4584_02895 [Armatimonadetes bacterium]|nr:MAG: hypothetical protein C4584_02895 [Armatimonadota bacterium]
MRVWWQSWKYKNLTIFFISIVVAILLSRTETLHNFLINLGSLSYFGAFIAGIFFVSTFTVATSAVVLLILAESLSPLEIGIIAGLGAVIGDLTIFRLIKDNVLDEIRPIFNALGNHYPLRVLHTRYFSWTLPVIGGLLIASPLPDEVGISLMGIAKLKTYQFIIVSFILNAIGIFLIVSASTFIKP